MKFCVPAGVGDFSWVYSKLCNTGLRFEVEFPDDAPYRGADYAQLFPMVEKAGYGPIRFPEILAFEAQQGLRADLPGQNPTWGHIRNLIDKGVETCFLEANRHLEMGRPLRDWLPDLLANYHYPVRNEPFKMDIPAGAMPVGISCASYRGAAAWSTWAFKEWTRFLSQMERHIPNVFWVFMGGGWDDLTRVVAGSFKPGKALNVIGITTAGESISVLLRLDGYIGFSSGLGIMGTVVRTPVAMLWPQHQALLSSSWADPEDLRMGRYIPFQYMNPEDVADALAICWKTSGVVKGG